MNAPHVEPPGGWSTEVLSTDPHTGLLAEGDLRRVCSWLRDGWPVGLPTETVYGLAAPALEEAACARIFAAKERPWTDPLICHIPDMSWLERIGETSPLANRLAEAFWPGPLTMVLPKQSIIPDLVTAGQPTVAVRQPRQAAFAQILRALDTPLAAPSANRFGCVSPTTAAHVRQELGGRIPGLVDGGPCELGLESTIVLVKDASLRILRAGPILAAELAEFAPVEEQAKAGADAAPSLPTVPGGLPWHYAPRTKLQLWTDLNQSPTPPSQSGGRSAGLLSWQGARTSGWAQIEVLSPTGDDREAARHFYAALRRLDAAELDLIVAELAPPEGLGATINERLRKAAARA